MGKIVEKKKKRTLLPLGLILLLGGFAVNTTFMVIGIHGYLRELTRLTTIIGFVVVAVGLVQVVVKFIRSKKIK